MFDNAAIVRQFVEEVVNQGDINGLGRFMSEDIVQHFRAKVLAYLAFRK